MSTRNSGEIRPSGHCTDSKGEWVAAPMASPSVNTLKGHLGCSPRRTGPSSQDGPARTASLAGSGRKLEEPSPRAVGQIYPSPSCRGWWKADDDHHSLRHPQQWQAEFRGVLPNNTVHCKTTEHPFNAGHIFRPGLDLNLDIPVMYRQ